MTNFFYLFLTAHICFTSSLFRHNPSLTFRKYQRLQLNLGDFPTEPVTSSNLVNDIQNAAIILSGLAYIVYERRPRGSARNDLIEIKKSKAISNNLGVFAKKFIPEGTTIGIYPGYLKTVEEFQKSSKFFLLLFNGYFKSNYGLVRGG